MNKVRLVIAILILFCGYCSKKESAPLIWNAKTERVSVYEKPDVASNVLAHIPRDGTAEEIDRTNANGQTWIKVSFPVHHFMGYGWILVSHLQTSRVQRDRKLCSAKSATAAVDELRVYHGENLIDPITSFVLSPDDTLRICQIKPDAQNRSVVHVQLGEYFHHKYWVAGRDLGFPGQVLPVSPAFLKGRWFYQPDGSGDVRDYTFGLNGKIKVRPEGPYLYGSYRIKGMRLEAKLTERLNEETGKLEPALKASPQSLQLYRCGEVALCEDDVVLRRVAEDY